MTSGARGREAAASAAQYALLGGFAGVATGISAQGLTGFARDNMGLHGAWPVSYTHLTLPTIYSV